MAKQKIKHYKTVSTCCGILYVEYHAHMSERFLINIKYGNPKYVFPKKFLIQDAEWLFAHHSAYMCPKQYWWLGAKLQYRLANALGILQACTSTKPSIYCCHHSDIHVQYITINMLSVEFLRFGVILYFLVLPKPFRVASPALSQRWSQYLLSNPGSLFAKKTPFYWYRDSHYKHVTTVSGL